MEFDVGEFKFGVEEFEGVRFVREEYVDWGTEGTKIGGWSLGILSGFTHFGIESYGQLRTARGERKISIWSRLNSWENKEGPEISVRPSCWLRCGLRRRSAANVISYWDAINARSQSARG